MRGQDPGSEHERETDNPASPPMPPPSFGQSSGWDAGQADTPPWGMPDPAPQPWQPPPAFTAAAAGMQVWKGPSSDQSPAWPAATGEPIGEPWPGRSSATSGPVPGTVSPGPATAAATHEAAARDAVFREGASPEVTIPGGHFSPPAGPSASAPDTAPPAPATGQDPTRPNGIAAEPRFFLPDPATGLIPIPGSPAGSSGDSGTQNFPLAEPTSDPLPRTGAHDTGAHTWKPGTVPDRPASGTPATEWAVGSAGAPERAGPAAGAAASPWNTLVGLAATGESAGAPRKEEQQRPGRQGSPNTDPLDIPVWPPPGAKPADDAPAAGGASLSETTIPVARLSVPKPGESGGAFSAAAPPSLPPSSPPGVPSAARPTVANPILSAPTPGGTGPSTVAGPFVGFNSPATPPGGVTPRPSAFTPAFTPAPTGQTGPTEPAGFGPVRPAGAAGTTTGGMGRKALIGAGIVVAIGAIGVGAYFAYQGLGDSAGPQAHGRVPSVVTPPQPDATASAEPIDSAETDAKEMTPAEAFPAAKVTIDGRTFRRVKVNVTGRCEQGAAGKFAEALEANRCAKLLRATYVDGRRRYAVTTGIAVLPSKDAAVKVDTAKDLAANVWFRGLPGPARSGGERVEISGGYAAGLVWGRYIVFSYATYADGHTPKAEEKDLGPISDAFRKHTAKAIEKRLASG